ncbi:MAG: hypothetical protein SV375_04510 [Thermodesulfobacteriota bacterium]|nr:hypothetical protein [Thermodesulfobacteriota bacterium]
MNKKLLLRHIVILTLGIAGISFNVQKSSAFELGPQNSDSKIHGCLTIRASAGYRMDYLDWNIAGDQDGQNPNIISELEFDDIEIYQRGLEANLLVNQIYSSGSIHFGNIKNGECTDSDYDEDNRTELWSRSKSEINNDDVFDMRAGLGYQFPFFGGKLKIAPLIGGSYHEQNLRLTAAVQTEATHGRTPDVGPIPDLNSTYETEWRSLWFGMDIGFQVLARLFLSSSIEYHKADYEAKADWNLRSDLQHPVSFTHEADAEGLVITIGINYSFAKHWDARLTYDRQRWSTGKGECRFVLANGQTSTQRLNEVNWDSQSIDFSLSYAF